MAERRIAHGTVFPSAPDRFPGDVQHLVSPIVGMLRLEAAHPDSGRQLSLDWIEQRLSFLLEMAEDVHEQQKRNEA